MAFPTVSVVDNFTYSNGALATVSGGAWSSPVGLDFNVSSNTIFPVVGAGAIVTYATGGDIDDCEAFITVTTLPGSGETAGLVWLDGSGNGYGVTYTHGAPGTLQVFEIAGYSGTPLGASASVTLSAGDQIGMQISGATTIDGYTATGGAWTLQLSRSDGTYTTARRNGISATGTNVGMDAFASGTTVAPPAGDGGTMVLMRLWGP
jgi:hypothetical protein